MEREALGSELDGNPAERRAIWSREDFRFWTSSWPAHSFFTVWYAEFKAYPSADVTTIIVTRMTPKPFGKTHS